MILVGIFFYAIYRVLEPNSSYAHLGLYVNQLVYIIDMFENHQTDSKPAQSLSTRPS